MDVEVLFASLEHVLLVGEVDSSSFFEGLYQYVEVRHEEVAQLADRFLVSRRLLDECPHLLIQPFEHVDHLPVKGRVDLLTPLQLVAHLRQIALKELVVVDVDLDHFVHVSCKIADSSPVLLRVLLQDHVVLLTYTSFCQRVL